MVEVECGLDARWRGRFDEGAHGAIAKGLKLDGAQAREFEVGG